MTTEEKLQHFTSVILESTESQCEKDFNIYKEKLDKDYEERSKALLKQREIEKQVEADNIKRRISKEYTTEQQRIRRKINKKQIELKDKLLAEVEAMLESFFTTAEYKELLVKQINAALKVARGETINIFLDKRDEKLKGELEKLTNTELIVDGRSFYGGIKAEIPKKNILIDNSFESKMDSWMETYIIEPAK